MIFAAGWVFVAALVVDMATGSRLGGADWLLPASTPPTAAAAAAASATTATAAAATTSPASQPPPKA